MLFLFIMLFVQEVNSMQDCEQIPADTNAAVKEPLPNPVPAAIIVTLSSDKMKAYIELKPPIGGGAAPTLTSLEHALAEHNVCYGVNAGILKRLAETPLYEEHILVALGDKPVNGENGSFTLLFNATKSFKAKERPDGSIDFHNLDIVENVSKDQLLCTITPPKEGVDGLSVTNRRILHKKGKPLPSMTGKNTRLGDDGVSVFSNIDGQVEFDGKKIHVNECLYVKNIDFSTGNVKVNGNLFIQGTVQQGLSVEAGGNIDVQGTVESALLKASGNIILHSGITGSQLHCDGDLTSRFIENCTVFAKGSIDSEYILNSRIQCGQCLLIKGSRSKFLGGSCLVGQSIISRDIGSPAGVKSELELGTNPEIIEKQQEIVRLIPDLERQNQSLKPLIDLFQKLRDANRLTPDKQTIYENIMATYHENKNRIETAIMELEHINENIVTKGYGKIICTGTIYPGTRVKFGSANMVVTSALQNTSIYYDKGEIRQGPAL